MKRQVRFTAQAEQDLLELYDFLAEHDLAAAERALSALRKAFELMAEFPFSCRKPAGHPDPILREMVVGFGRSGYVVLFEIDSPRWVTGIAVRHQREDDFH